jgi:hypothetical protein
MSLIAEGQIFLSFPLNAYLVFLFLKSQIQDISPKSNYSSVKKTEQFYIKHVDDKGDHLMVDEELNIIGIIDWQMARVVPADEAFGPSLVTAEMGDIYDGFSSVTIHDRALARLLKEKGKMTWLISCAKMRSCGGSSLVLMWISPGMKHSY